MSIKIYQGFIVKDQKDFLKHLLDLQHKYQFEYARKQEEEYMQLLETYAENHPDFYDNFNFTDHYFDFLKLKKKHVISLYNASIDIYSIDNQTIGIINGPSDLFETWISYPSIEDYSYWDNSDMSETYSKEEIENRKNVWEKILNQNFPYENQTTLRVNLQEDTDNELYYQLCCLKLKEKIENRV